MKILTKVSGLILFNLLSFSCFAYSDLRLKNINGDYQSMKQMIGQGKWTVVNIWSPSCSFCVEELPHMKTFADKHKDAITIFGVTLDFPGFAYGNIELDEIEAFIENYEKDNDPLSAEF